MVKSTLNFDFLKSFHFILVDLMKLLNWKSSPKQLGDTLNKIMKLGGEEVVKFLQDVLDALFSMFSTEDGNSTQHSGLVFHVLVSIVAYLDDPKFENFRPVMDAYISQHFSAALVYKYFLFHMFKLRCNCLS